MDRMLSGMISARVAAGLAAQRLRPARSLAARLADLPERGLPLDHPASICWDRHAIPFVEAAGDADAAVALGLVHAHLRLGQMEVMRRIALGRVAEMLGPAATDIDHGLLLLDLARAVPAILAGMPAFTRAWLDGFAAGISHYVRHTPRLPPEFAWLGLGREAWGAADVLALGRLASADVNWMVLFNLVRLRTRADWPSLWADIARAEGAAPQPLAEDGANPLGRIATRATRSGSNALAVAGWRSASGAALMAADPHLHITLPNVWLAAGVKSPSLNMAGLMIPGLPFVAIGRNRDIAWSGTSLQSASSDLFDASALETWTRRRTIRRRWAGPARLDLTDTPLGPLVSDTPLLAGVPPLALTWAGHWPSDELTAWLDVARASDWDGFTRAAEGMAVPGQNLVYADRRGRVGKLIAAHLPRRPPGAPPDAVLPPVEAAAWRDRVRSGELPRQVDPPGGIVASANEAPRHGAVRVGLFFSGHDRFLRLNRLGAGRRRLDLDDLAGFQSDVFSESALELAGWMARRLDGQGVGALLDGWDGCYHADSRAASAYEMLLAGLRPVVYGDAGQAAYWASWDPGRLVRRRLDRAGVEPALRAAAAAMGEPPEWGELHRLRLDHMLGGLPFARRAARFADLPCGGGNETLMKTAHGLAEGRHGVRFGANARFLADLAAPDRNFVVLLGGQDGWIGSACFLDQVPLWRQARLIPLPLGPESARARAVHVSRLRP